MLEKMKEKCHWFDVGWKMDGNLVLLGKEKSKHDQFFFVKSFKDQ